MQAGQRMETVASQLMLPISKGRHLWVKWPDGKTVASNIRQDLMEVRRQLQSKHCAVSISGPKLGVVTCGRQAMTEPLTKRNAKRASHVIHQAPNQILFEKKCYAFIAGHVQSST